MIHASAPQSECGTPPVSASVRAAFAVSVTGEALAIGSPTNGGGRMSNQEQRAKSGLVFGARNLGGAIIDTLIADGWAMAGVARSTATLEKIAKAGALALEADVTDQASVTRALGQAAEANGRIDLVVMPPPHTVGPAPVRLAVARSRRRAQMRSTRGPPRPLAPRSHSSPAQGASSPRRAASQRSSK
jgi:hypothetical protein